MIWGGWMTDNKNLSQLQRALFAIKKLKQELRDKDTSPQPIAIIGLGCKFPSVVNKQAYWDLLKQGENVISHLPEQRLNLLKGSKEYDLHQSDYPYWGGYLTGIEQFDPFFFGITPREALLMDPQQRLLLEVTYEALEDAGLPVEHLAGSNTGVFIGMYGSEFSGLQSIETDMDALYLPTGNASSIAANRISYQFDLHGPSLTLDTACSSSLVAINFACASLQNKQCNVAIVGGAKINLLPSTNVLLSQAKMLSPDGQCKTFDASANGYVQGEGVGVVILKRLTDALRDNDRIYSVIVGSAINQDGKSNGLTAPNGAQQEKLLQNAYEMSGIDPAQVGYIECHGTGTVLGDPIEVEALEHVIGIRHSEEEPCWLGSVKTNIGHLEPAAGIASIIKVSLALQEGKIPAHQNFLEPNPHIPFNRYHFEIPLQYQDWPVYGEYRVAGVSGFGFGGTNAHVVLRETYGSEKPVPSIANNGVRSELFTLSAKDPVALQLLIERWCIFFEKNRSLDLSQVCYNAHLKRSHYFYRLAIIANSTEDLYDLLLKLKQEPGITSPYLFTQANKQAQTHSDQEVSQNTDLSVLANEYLNHKEIDWIKYEASRNYSPIDMPLYPWQHQRYWPEFRQNKKENASQENQKALPSYPLQGKQSSPLEFEFTLDTRIIPELADTYNVAHIGFYLEMLAFASHHIAEQINFEIRDLILGAMIYIPKDKPMHVRLIFKEMAHKKYTFRIYSQDDNTEKQMEHAHGQLIVLPLEDPASKLPSSFKENLSLSGSGDDFFKRIKSMDMPIGGSIRWTEKFWKNSNNILSQFRREEADVKPDLYALQLHPGVFDACVQPLFILLDDEIRQPYLTTKIKSFKYFGATGKELFAFVERLSDFKTGELISGNWNLFDSDGRVIATCDSIQLTQLGRKQVVDQEANLFTPSLDKLNVAEVPENEREERVINLLRDHVAFIFKMPSIDVSIERPLIDMGMDSLMTMVLSKKIEESMGIGFSLQELLKPISIKDIAAQVLVAVNPVTTHANAVINPYLPYCQRRIKPKIRLFCFPFGGGSASVYRSWHHDFPDDIEVCPVQLPGRENLETTAAIADLNALITTLYTNIASELEIPFAFYGHSFGSLIAFELTRYLKRNHLRLPLHLFVAAYPAPHLSNPIKFRALVRHLNHLPYNLWDMSPQDLSERQLRHIMILIKGALPDMDYRAYDAELLRSLISYFLADIRIVANYQYFFDAPLELPITSFYGSHDRFLSKKSKEWGTYTNELFDLFEINGEHLFIKTQQGKQETIQIIINKLSNVSGG